MARDVGEAPDEHRDAVSSAHLRALASGLRQLFDRAPALVVLLGGPEHVIEYANPAYTALVGHRVLEGRRVRDALPELAEQGFTGLLDQVYQTREPFVGEGMLTRIRQPDGAAAEMYFDFVYQPVVGPDGEVLGVFGQGTDVTARVRAEQALRESEARLELATSAADLGVWDWNLETGEIVFDARARALWGFPASGPVTEAMMAAAIHPDDVPETNARFGRAIDPAIRDGSPYEYRVVRAGGEVRWVRAQAQPVFAERDGRTLAVRYVGTMEDITERKRAEEALKASEARLRLALDASRMAVWAVDAAGQVEVSPEFNRMLGLPEAARPTLEELQSRYYPGELERLQQLGAAALARGERYIEFEYRHLLPTDEPRWLLVRAEFLMSEAAEPLGAIGVIMDITERRESEERLKLLAREVDHRANNLLAVVQGAITLSEAPTAAELKTIMLGRVAALAKAHQLLASSRWIGADLRSLVEDELEPYCSDAQCLQVEGPTVALSPAVAQGMAMVLHELATNAVKYGALSTSAGRVAVSWTGGAPNSTLRLTWEETGGPAVAAPSRSGMGTKVIARALSGQLGGRADLEWRPEGLICRIEVWPSAQARPHAAPSPEVEAAAPMGDI